MGDGWRLFNRLPARLHSRQLVVWQAVKHRKVREMKKMAGKTSCSDVNVMWWSALKDNNICNNNCNNGRSPRASAVTPGCASESRGPGEK